LEFASTLRQEYPRANITIVDENKNNFLNEYLGEEIAGTLVQYFKNRGVNIMLKKDVKNFLLDIDEDDMLAADDDPRVPRKIRQLLIHNKTKDRKPQKFQRLNTDLMVMFPNRKGPDFTYMNEYQYKDEFEFDSLGRLKVDHYMMSPWKRMFSAGSCVAGRNPVSLQLYSRQSP
jgi:NADH dehydrogenase FAD-containing subunit